MARLREGRANTARGAAHFLTETIGRVRDAGASGQLTVRADSGFYAHAGVAVLEGTLLPETIGLADRGVEIDRQRSRARSGAGRPRPREEVSAHQVELADVAPPEAAQERAQGGRPP